jgi:hypothetical protein
MCTINSNLGIICYIFHLSCCSLSSWNGSSHCKITWWSQTRDTSGTLFMFGQAILQQWCVQTHHVQYSERLGICNIPVQVMHLKILQATPKSNILGNHYWTILSKRDSNDRIYQMHLIWSCNSSSSRSQNLRMLEQIQDCCIQQCWIMLRWLGQALWSSRDLSFALI